MPSDIKKDLPEIEKYFRESDPSLPPLEFEDKDGDGRADLFDTLGNESSFREVPTEWAHLLKSIAVNTHESQGGGVELSREDWAVHQQEAVALKKGQASGRTVLANGLTVIVESDFDKPFVRVGFVAFTGSIDDPDAQRGISHGLEHVVVGNSSPEGRQGMRKAMTAFGGGEAPINTLFDRTFYSFFVRKPGLKGAFRLWDTALTGDAYDKGRVDAEVNGVLQQEYRRYLGMPSRRLTAVFLKGLFPDHPLGESGVGDLERIQAMTLQDFQAHHANTYVSNNMAVKFYGPITLKEAVALVKANRLGSTPGKPVSRPSLTLKPLSSPRVEILASDTATMPALETTEFSMGWRLPTLADRPDPVALDMALSLLTRRLEQRLVASGQVDEVSVNAYYISGTGWMSLDISGSAKNMKAAIRDAQAMIEQLKRYPADRAELESLRAEWTASAAFDEEDGNKHIRFPLEDSRDVNAVTAAASSVRRAETVQAADLTQAAAAAMPGVGDYSFVALEQGVDPASFSSPEDLLRDMTANMQAPVTPYAFKATDRADYPKVSFPAKIPAPRGRRLPDGRRTYDLPNGIHVTLVPAKKGRVISTILRAPLGAGFDPVGQEGLRGLLLKNMFRGTDRVSLEAFEQEMGLLGTRAATNSDADSVSVVLQSPAGNTLEALQLFLHAAQNPRLSDEDITATKQSLDGERKALESDASSLATLVATQDIYLDPRGVRSAPGSAATVAAIERSDVRHAFERFTDPKTLEVTLSGPVTDGELRRILYVLSKIPSQPASAPLPDASPALKTNGRNTRPIYDDLTLRALGLEKFTDVRALYTPREIAVDDDKKLSTVSVQGMGPKPDSWEYPYYVAFTQIIALRTFNRLVYGVSKGRPDGKGYLYKATVTRNVQESTQPVIGEYKFEAGPDQIGRVLQDYFDECAQTLGTYAPNQEELRTVVEGNTLKILLAQESAQGRAENSELQDHHPMFFRTPNGRLEKITTSAEIQKRLARLPIQDVLKIGGKYFDPKNNPPVVHVVGFLPEDKKIDF